MSKQDNIPPGFTLRHTLPGHTGGINRIAWSPDGRILASPSHDRTIRLWDAHTGKLLRTLRGHSANVSNVAWSPDGRMLVSGSYDRTIRLWDVQTGQQLQKLEGHTSSVFCTAWAPHGRLLASGSEDKTICLWDTHTWQPLQTLRGHSNSVCSIAWAPHEQLLASSSSDKTICLWDTHTWQPLQTLRGHSDNIRSVAWSPDGRVLTSGSLDHTIRLWNPNTGQQMSILEGHTGSIYTISFSSDGRLLASKSGDGTVRLWRIGTWEAVAILEESVSDAWTSSLVFHPTAPILATLGEKDTVIHIWDLDVPTLLRTAPATPSVHYTNAKVVLVGDAGVGKSGLSLVLTRQRFVPTESTHGRHVWVFENQMVERKGKIKETHETLLWDLAGQPDYRLVHQLHLNEVTVALLVFDASRENDQFTGVRYWDRALRLAQQVSGNTAHPLKKFLVAARLDRGGINVSVDRIRALAYELGCVGTFGTSAKEGWYIAELAQAIREAIPWDALPKVTSPELFQQMKQFQLTEKQEARLLSTVDELYYRFLRSKDAPKETGELRAQFETCLGHVASAGLVRRLSFGNLVLLQPELLDAYASALLIAVKNEPGDLGSISEERVRRGQFAVPQDVRLKNAEQEKLLLIAMIEELLRHELALREHGDLIFPSQFTREHPNLSDPEGKAVSFTFEGPVLNLYTTLVVRLSHSSIFRKKELWKNAATYTTRIGGTYGMVLQMSGEERGELTLFFDKAAGEEMRFHFEEYIQEHLQQHALPNSVQRRRLFVCPTCGESFTEKQVKNRRDQGKDWITCSNCDTRVSLLDKEERLRVTTRSLVAEMDRAADSQRDRATAQTTVEGKIATRDFDVFLSHRGADKPWVRETAKKLKEHGILPWLDEEQLQPGLPWQRLLEQQIGQIKSAAVCIGKQKVEKWEQEESEALLSQFMKRGCPVIPVILPDAPEKPEVPLFLGNRTWVDFRKQDPDPMERLIWGITGKKGPLQL